jgi:hypothetical protein
MRCFVQFARPSLLSHIFCGLLHIHVGLILITSATIILDIVHTLLRLLGICNRSSFHQCHTEWLFNFKKGPDVQTVSNSSEFLRDTLNIWDNDSALVYCIWRRMTASWWLHYRVNKFLWVFIKHQIVSYVLNFIVEILLVLTYDLDSTDQTMNASHFGLDQYEKVYGTLLWLILDPTSWPNIQELYILVCNATCLQFLPNLKSY